MSIHILGRSDVWTRLASTNVGRLGVTVEALPIVVPVNYVVGDHHSLIFAVGSGTTLSRAIDGTVFAFEAGGLDVEAERWWSVVVRGRANLVGASHPSARTLDQLHLRSEVRAAIGVAQLVRGGEVQSSQEVPVLAAYLTS